MRHGRAHSACSASARGAGRARGRGIGRGAPGRALPLFLGFGLCLAMMAGADGRAAAAALDSLLAAPSLQLPLLERSLLERNPDIVAAQAAWQAARARAGAEGRWSDPMLDLMVAPASLGSSEVDAAYRVGLRQAVPLFGTRGLAREAALGEARVVEADYRRARLDLLQEARKAYYETYQVARAREVNHTVAALMEQMRHTALARYSAGTAALQDALQSQAELAMLDHDRVALERQARQLRARLNTLLHRAPGDSLPLPPAQLPLDMEQPTLDTLTARAVRLRPELAAAEARVDVQRSQLELSRRQGLPELELQGMYDRYMAEKQWRPSVGLSLSLPINRGRLRDRQREAQAGLAEASARLAAQRDQVSFEVADALARVNESAHEAELLRTSVVPATEQALDATRSNYQASRADFQAVLSAQRDLVRARLSLDRAVTDYHQARADLARAVGQAPADSNGAAAGHGEMP